MKYILLLFLISFQVLAQSPTDLGIDDDDLNIGGDIFSDFNEDLEATQVQEDERFYKYGRFFSFHIGIGLTSFDGNRGQLYNNDPPGYGLGFYYFSDFRTAFGLGFQYSQHHFFIDEPVFAYSEPLGFVDVSMLRVWFGYRYYIDTADLGTAITYSNPYFTVRMEYWYVTSKFRDQSEEPDDTGGGFGLSAGFGLEFPIKIKDSYINVEFLVHSVNYHDKYTQDYAPPASNPNGFGFSDLTGRAYSTFVNYVINWGP